MRVNPILPSYPVKPVSRMKVSYFIEVEAYEPTADPAPAWLVALGLVSLVILIIVALALWA